MSSLIEVDLSPLRGKNLACFCRLDQQAIRNLHAISAQGSLFGDGQ